VPTEREETVFVRMKVQARPNVKLLAVELVESIRVDGKPRQRVAAYLGSIDTAKTRDPEAREKFLRGFYTAINGWVRWTSLHHKQPSENPQKFTKHARFWDEDDQRYYLNSTRPLAPSERKAAEEALARFMPPPTDEERKKYDVS
jgi:hypothetical protein